MTIEQVTVGMEVWLKSGGPPMVVVSTGNTRVECGWFEMQNDLYHTSHFPPAALLTEAEGKAKDEKRIRELKGGAHASPHFNSITLNGGE